MVSEHHFIQAPQQTLAPISPVAVLFGSSAKSSNLHLLRHRIAIWLCLLGLNLLADVQGCDSAMQLLACRVYSVLWRLQTSMRGVSKGTEVHCESG